MRERPIRILHLEANRDDADLAAREVEQRGLKAVIDHVVDGTTFLKALEKRRYDIILADWNLPGCGGARSLAMARKHQANTPFIFCSRSMGTEAAAEVLKKGAADCVLKGRLSRLVPGIRQALMAREAADIRRQSRELHREALEALRQSEERHRMILDSIQESYYELDLAGNLTFFNLTVRMNLGYSDEELQGMNFRDYVVPHHLKRVTSAYREVYRTGHPVMSAQWELVTKSGRLLPVDTSISLIRDSEGKPVGFRGVVRDLSERNKAEAERRKIRKALQASEENYRRSLDESPLGIRIVSRERETLYVNTALLDMFEYGSIREWYATPLEGRYTDKGRQEHRKRAAERRSGEDLSEYEVEIVAKDGSLRQLRVWRKKITWNGSDHDQVIYHDITSQRRAEAEREAALEKLRESMERLQGILENNPLLISEISCEGRYNLVNRSVARFFGIPEKELTGRGVIDVAGPGMHVLFLERMSMIRETRSPLVVEDLLDRDGVERCFSTVLFPLFNDRGGLQSIGSISQDITDRKQAEREREAVLEELRQSRGKLEGIIEFLPDAALVIDGGGKVMAWNRAMETLTGVAAGGMIGKGSYEYAVPFFGQPRPMLADVALNPALAERTVYKAVHRRGDTVIAEAISVSMPPGNLHLSAVASILRDTEGNPIGAIELVRDDTERRDLERRLQQAEKMTSLSRISAGVAHEILNPVGIISLELKLLLAMEDLPRHVRRELQVCLEQVHRVVEIADNLKEFSKTSRDEVAPGDINDLVAVLLNLYATQMKIEGVTLVTKYDQSIPLFSMDRKKIEQVLINLLSNALDAMEEVEDRMISIETRLIEDGNGKSVRIAVADTGSGIALKDMGRLFEPFFTTRDQGKGAGMGLSISHGIIRQHGGEIWAENNESSGVTFFVDLPLAGLSEVKQTG